MLGAEDQEGWARRVAKQGMTVEQYTEIQIWTATGLVKYQITALTDDVSDALASLVEIEMPPLFTADQPELKAGIESGVG